MGDAERTGISFWKIMSCFQLLPLMSGISCLLDIPFSYLKGSKSSLAASGEHVKLTMTIDVNAYREH